MARQTANHKSHPKTMYSIWEPQVSTSCSRVFDSAEREIMSKTRQRLFAAALLVATLAWGFREFATAQDVETTPPPRWEYKIHKGEATSSVLNALGGDGWELVAIEPAMPYMFGPGRLEHSARVFYFKRPK
jgi:hypothetical protein